jgi:hypothetical protein
MAPGTQMRRALSHMAAAGLAAAVCLPVASAHAGGSAAGCVDNSANQAVAAGGDNGLHFTRAFYRQTFAIDVSTDGFAKHDLTISIEAVCNAPAAYAAQAVQLAGLDGIAYISSRTRVDMGGRRLRGAARRTAIGGADTMHLTVRLARPSHWRPGEDGNVPTFSTLRAEITD